MPAGPGLDYGPIRAMQSPMRRLVTALSGPVRNLAVVVQQIADQKSKSGPAAESAEPSN